MEIQTLIENYGFTTDNSNFELTANNNSEIVYEYIKKDETGKMIIKEVYDRAHNGKIGITDITITDKNENFQLHAYYEENNKALCLSKREFGSSSINHKISFYINGAIDIRKWNQKSGKNKIYMENIDGSNGVYNQGFTKDDMVETFNLLNYATPMLKKLAFMGKKAYRTGTDFIYRNSKESYERK